ncbi:cytochrome c oxidase subunit II [Pelagerythrobacter sp.]|uniref:cytochrome c oxidase subunit II n=1 Tax=Pelagerythrobacter sp. TaxID=2800702 RepID=UPI0035B4D210
MALLAACAGPLSTLDPAGPSARAVADLWWIMLAGAGALCLLVFGLLAVALLRPSMSRGNSERLWLGWLGVAMPCVVLAALLVYALALMARQAPGEPAASMTVGVEARQYAWAFTHQRGGTPIATENVLNIPAGRPVDLEITAIDVIHSFWIPRLAGKMDAIPGHVNRIRIEADAPGRYRGVCAEYCGVGHQGHGFTVIAHDARGWAEFAGGSE